ncbi:hypothetical protein [Desulfosporosinus acidiphilus]|uniref:hypothetical protein n=1 Tax=Desulfosporosinus acidiphilus TaxID=885581 RepID=UPI0002DE9820|nr:hypothetical protein [Desulfosporosinus acidiphilus]
MRQTHGGGGFGQIENEIAKECLGATILPGIALNGTFSADEVANWLKTFDRVN